MRYRQKDQVSFCNISHFKPANQFLIYHIRKGMLITQTFQIKKSQSILIYTIVSRVKVYHIWEKQEASSSWDWLPCGVFLLSEKRIFYRHWCWPCPSCMHLMGPICISNRWFYPLPNFLRLYLIYYLLSTCFVLCMQWQRDRYICNIDYLIELHFSWAIPQ